MSGPTYQVIEYPAGSGKGYEPRGAALQLWRCKAPEVIVSGPAETGKTLACCHKLDALLWKYPGAQAVMLRREYKTLIPTAYQTLRKKVHGDDSPVRPYGGEHPEWLDYPNGSRLWLAGLDYPGKALSSERDFVYVNQAEEVSLEAWGVLCSRATGRAGNAPYPQVMGDCNPGAPTHWIRTRSQEGRLVLLESRHEDNPTLWDGANWTDQGRLTLAALDALPGVLRDRLRYGRWVAAEGTVYSFDARLHLIDPFPVPASWRRLRSIDFGYSNPFACLWLAVDGDGRLFLYRELYHTQRTVREHAALILRLSAGERIEATISDHDAEDRATLHEAGIWTLPADKAVSPGIQAVQARLALAGDGRPRLFLFRGALVERDESLAAARKPVCTAEEMDVYSWPKGADGRPMKEAPLKVNDHGCFVAGTKIRTARGVVAIEDVRAGDRVLTRRGFRRVSAAGLTAEAAPVLTVTFSDGRTLTGTGNHPVWVEATGFARLDSLRYGDRVLTPEDLASCHGKHAVRSNASVSTASSIGVIPSHQTHRIGPTFNAAWPTSCGDIRTCTATYGSSTAARSRTGARSITRTRTPRTTTSITWSASPRRSTAPVIRRPRNGWRSSASSWTVGGPGRRHGMAERPGASGTGSTDGRSSATCPSAASPVQGAASLSVPARRAPCSARTSAGQRLAGLRGPMTCPAPVPCAKRRSRSTGIPGSSLAAVAVVAVSRESGSRAVYNLTVEGCPEYFANGVLVHNCDALRYVVRHVDGTVPLTRGSIGTSKRSAVAGLPQGVFRTPGR